MPLPKPIYFTELDLAARWRLPVDMVVRYLRDERYFEWDVPAEQFKGSGEDVRGDLLRKGLRITTALGPRQKLATYIQFSEPKDKRRAICTDRTGWHGDVFVFPETTLGKHDKEQVLFQSATAGALHPFGRQGPVDGWQKQVAALCDDNSRLLFAASCAFAGPLLEITRAESGGVHFTGGSSSGKTTALDVASSVWGHPDTFRQSWRATDNGLEGIAALYNDTLLPLDELAQIDPRKVGEVAYLLGNGQGKGRAGKDGAARHRKQWRILFLSSGEIGLADHMAAAGMVSKAGMELRLADIPADAGAGLGLFQSIHGHPTPAHFAEHLKQGARRCYGTAGPAFIMKLIENQCILYEEIEAHRQTFNRQYLPHNATGQIERAARRFSLIAAAGELATEYGLTGWPKGAAIWGAGECFEAWLATWGTGYKEEARLVQQVREYFEKHGEARFTPMHDTTGNPEPDTDRATINRAGFRQRDTDGETEYFVLPEAFREICNGFAIKQSAVWLAARGILSPGEDRASKSMRLPGMGKKRAYHITAAVHGD